METLEQEAGLKAGEKNDSLDLDWCGCLGYCAKSPNLVIDDRYYVFTTSAETVLTDIEEGGEDMEGKEIVIEQQFDALFENDPLS